MKQTELIIFAVIMVINAVFAIWKKYKERLRCAPHRRCVIRLEIRLR